MMRNLKFAGLRYAKFPKQSIITARPGFACHFSTAGNPLPTTEDKEQKSASKKTLKGYLELTKAQLVVTVAFTSAITYISAGTADFQLLTMGSVFFGTSLCGFSAAVMNQVWEKEGDAKMSRTKNRPMVTGLISDNNAKLFSAGLGASGVGMLLACTNPLTAAIGAANIGLYAGLYTWSKYRTEWNTEIGAITGALPVFMGWAAATGNIWALEPWLLGAYMFMWQFPHFYSMAFIRKEDYSRAGMKMLPCNDPDGMRTAKSIMGYSIGLLAFPFVSCALDATTYMYAVEGGLVGAWQVYLAKRFYDERTDNNARKNMYFSYASIMVMFIGFLLHSRNTDKKDVKNMVSNVE